MKTVTPPVRVAADDLQFCVDRARTEAERVELEGRRQDVTDQYAAYPVGGGRPHRIALTDGWPEAQTFRDLWRLRSRAGPIGELWAQTLEAAERCVFCDCRQAEEADHFLPQRFYPALTVFHLNLVGACGRCNEHKSDSADRDPLMQFLHPYCDVLPPDEVFLHCTPFADRRFAPLYRAEPPLGWPDEISARLVWQFERLKLTRYYRREAISWFRGQSLGWVRAARQGRAGLARSLEGALDSETRASGVNFWQCATIRGLLDDADFRADPVPLIIASGSRGLRPDS
jgi:hypothetical protein